MRVGQAINKNAVLFKLAMVLPLEQETMYEKDKSSSVCTSAD